MKKQRNNISIESIIDHFISHEAQKPQIMPEEIKIVRDFIIVYTLERLKNEIKIVQKRRAKAGEVFKNRILEREKNNASIWVHQNDLKELSFWQNRLYNISTIDETEQLLRDLTTQVLIESQTLWYCELKLATEFDYSTFFEIYNEILDETENQTQYLLLLDYLNDQVETILALLFPALYEESIISLGNNQIVDADQSNTFFEQKIDGASQIQQKIREENLPRRFCRLTVKNGMIPTSELLESSDKTKKRGSLPKKAFSEKLANPITPDQARVLFGLLLEKKIIGNERSYEAFYAAITNNYERLKSNFAPLNLIETFNHWAYLINYLEISERILPKWHTRYPADGLVETESDNIMLQLPLILKGGEPLNINSFSKNRSRSKEYLPQYLGDPDVSKIPWSSLMQKILNEAFGC